MRLRALAALLALALIAGCADGNGETMPADAGADPTDSPAAVDADEPAEEGASEADDSGAQGDLAVVATLGPLADIVQRVLGDRGRVETLVPAGVDSHGYEPRPGDVAPLAEADIYFGVGLNLNTAAVDLAEANLPEGAPLVLLGEETLALDSLVSEHWHDHGHSHSHDHDDGHSHDHDHDHSHDHSHDHDHDHSHDHDDDHGNDHGGDLDDVNPHVWTSVPNMERFASGIAEALAEIDPEHAEEYAERAEAYRDQLSTLDEAVAEAVDSIPEGARKLVVYHDAWVYFGATYGVEVVAAVQPSDFSEPSASDVRSIIDQIRDEGVPAMFGSEEFPNDVVAAIAAETDAEYVGDLADDVLPGQPGDPEHSYVGMMRRNTAKIVEALGGDPSPLQALAP